jgi:hypothetical protein
VSHSTDKAAPTPPDTWFVATDFGTFEYRLDALKLALDKGSVHGRNLVWHVGLSDWVELAQEPLLKLLGLVPVAAAQPARVDSNAEAGGSIPASAPTRPSDVEFHTPLKVPAGAAPHALLDELSDNRTSVVAADPVLLLETEAESLDERTSIVAADPALLFDTDIASVGASGLATDESLEDDDATVIQSSPLVLPDSRPVPPLAPEAEPAFVPRVAGLPSPLAPLDSKPAAELLPLASAPMPALVPVLAESPTKLTPLGITELARKAAASRTASTAMSPEPRPSGPTLPQYVSAKPPLVRPSAKSVTPSLSPGINARTSSTQTVPKAPRIPSFAEAAPVSPQSIDSSRLISKDEAPARNVSAKPPVPLRTTSAPQRSAAPRAQSSLSPSPQARATNPFSPSTPPQTLSTGQPSAPPLFRPSAPANAIGPVPSISVAKPIPSFEPAKPKSEAPARNATPHALVAAVSASPSAPIEPVGDRPTPGPSDGELNTITPSISSIHSALRAGRFSRRTWLIVAGTLGTAVALALVFGLSSPRKKKRVAATAAQMHTPTPNTVVPEPSTAPVAVVDVPAAPAVASASAEPQLPEASAKPSTASWRSRISTRQPVAPKPARTARSVQETAVAPAPRSTDAQPAQSSVEPPAKPANPVADLDRGTVESRAWMKPGF